jgi:hypothetical protein
MIEPRPSVTRFANAVARAERAQAGAGHDSEVAQRITMRLHEELGKLVGDAGVDVLLRRSVVLARRAHPVLAGVTAGPGGTLAGLKDAALEGPELAELQDGARAIVGHFIELLVTLIGEDLAMGLARAVWPSAVEEEER